MNLLSGSTRRLGAEEYKQLPQHGFLVGLRLSFVIVLTGLSSTLLSFPSSNLTIIVICFYGNKQLMMIHHLLTKLKKTYYCTHLIAAYHVMLNR